MGQVLELLIDVEKMGYSLNEIVFFSNDEIVIDMEEYVSCIRNREITESKIKEYFNVPFKVELFYLRKINGINGYYKEIIKTLNEREYEFKCLDGYILPFVLRKFQNQEATESDKVFYHEGLLSEFIEVPEIKF